MEQFTLVIVLGIVGAGESPPEVAVQATSKCHNRLLLELVVSVKGGVQAHVQAHV